MRDRQSINQFWSTLLEEILPTKHLMKLVIQAICKHYQKFETTRISERVYLVGDF